MSFPAHDSKEMLALLTENIGATISIFDRDLVFRYVSASFARWYGVEPQQMVGRTVPDFFEANTFQGFRPYVDRALAGETLRYERIVRSHKVDSTWLVVSLVPIRNSHGEVIGVVNSALDVHELKTAYEALRVANQKLTGHIDNSPLAVIEFDASLHLLSWPARATAIFGYARDELGADPLTRLLRDNEDNALRIALARLREAGAANSRIELKHRRKDGSVVYCEWFNSALTDEAGRVTSIMSLVQDVSARFQAAEQLRFIAEHDSLTGLPNRAALHQRIDHALQLARDSGDQVALLFIDLDGFKRVNDSFGHAAGDIVLQETARRIATSVRATDTVARLGGDEFVVLLEGDVNDRTCQSVSVNVLDAIRPDYRFTVRHSDGSETAVTTHVSASIGVAIQPPLESQIERLFKRADDAMYAAKRAGKGCVRVADGA